MSSESELCHIKEIKPEGVSCNRSRGSRHGGSRIHGWSSRTGGRIGCAEAPADVDEGARLVEETGWSLRPKPKMERSLSIQAA